jgi:putative ABC transport system substrate-binding protein
MRRRTAILALTAFAAAPLGRALGQQTKRLPKLAILSPNPSASIQAPVSHLKYLLTELAALGYADGRNVSLEFRFADNAVDRLPGLAAELVATQPEVLHTWTTPGVRAAAAATSSIPIIAGPVNRATMAALATDLAHPVGNVTGFAYTGTEEHEDCLRLLKEAAPGVTRVGVLVNPLNPAWQAYPGLLSKTAQVLGVDLVRAEAHSAAEIERAFAAMAAQEVNGVFAVSDGTLLGDPVAVRRILEQVANRHLPSVTDDADLAGEGMLLVYHPDDPARERGLANYIHRVLQGAKPGDLPVVPAKMLLVVNLEAAQALGITVPASIQSRADEVIR